MTGRPNGKRCWSIIRRTPRRSSPNRMKARKRRKRSVRPLMMTARERRVFEARRLREDPPSLEDLGRELSISGERVRQIETLAFEKVKRAATRRLRSAVVPARELAG